VGTRGVEMEAAALAQGATSAVEVCAEGLSVEVIVAAAHEAVSTIPDHTNNSNKVKHSKRQWHKQTANKDNTNVTQQSLKSPIKDGIKNQHLSILFSSGQLVSEI